MKLAGKSGPLMLGATVAMAASALYVNYRSRKVEEDYPPAGQFVEVEGVRLHYLDRGQGRPLVLLHGNGVTSMDFELSGLVGMAAERYRVLAFDRPGFGYSERPRDREWGAFEQARLMLAALDRLGVEQPLVVGHSWGAMVALAMGLEAPERIAGIALLSGYYYPSERPEPGMAASNTLPLIGDLMRHTTSPLMFRAAWPSAVKLMFAPAEVPEHFKRFPAWMAVRPSQLEAGSADTELMISSAEQLSRRCQELKLPALIMVGSEDRLVPMSAHSERLHRELPQAQYRVLEELGHMIHHMAPRLVLEAIDELAAKVGEAPTGPTVAVDESTPDEGEPLGDA